MSIANQIATYVNADNAANQAALTDEQAVDDMLNNYVGSFSNGEIELHQAQDYAKEAHASLYDSLVFRVIGGDEVAVKGLQHLMTIAALELNELNGKRH